MPPYITHGPAAPAPRTRSRSHVYIPPHVVWPTFVQACAAGADPRTRLSSEPSAGDLSVAACLHRDPGAATITCHLATHKGRPIERSGSARHGASRGRSSAYLPPPPSRAEPTATPARLFTQAGDMGADTAPAAVLRPSHTEAEKTWPDPPAPGAL